MKLRPETPSITDIEILHGHLFCGLGGGARGFNRGEARIGSLRAKFRCVGGIDVDPASIADFTRAAGVPGTVLDLFSREQYEAFFGRKPPEDFREAQPDDIRRAMGGEFPHILFLSAPCLPSDGPVITETGTRAIKTVRAGDRVLTHRGRMRTVTHVGTHLYKGVMHGFRLNGTVDHQEFTDEHPLWVRKVVRTKWTKRKRMLDGAAFVPAKDVRVGDRIGFPIQFERKGTARAFIESLGRPQEVAKGGKTSGRYRKGAHVAKLGRVRDLTSLASALPLWWLIGAYLGDGYRGRGNRYEVNFCGGAAAGPLAKRVMDTLDYLGVTHFIDKSGGPTNVKIRAKGRHLHMICGAFGDGADKKCLPPLLMNLEDGQAKALIEGYRNTDGSYQPARRTPKGKLLQARWKIASVSLPLLRDIQRLLLRGHIFASIHKCWPGGPQTIMGREVQTKPRWELNYRHDPKKRTVFEFIDNAVWVRVREVTRRQTSERVWNLSVEEDDTYCAPMIATHNCKGFSGLLAESMSKTAKYQALNALTIRGVWLALEAFKDNPVELFVFENVPRIANRGRPLLDQIIALFRAYGYVVAETTHDCGELGNLGQSRKRFLLVARHVKKVPPFLYEPVKHPLRGVGEIIGRLPVPGPDAILPMHRMPSLQWKTWVRLAFVEAGADWRSLNKLNVDEGFLTDYGIEADYGYDGVLGINRWEDTKGAVTSRDGPTNGKNAVADPREVHGHDFHGLKVNEWEGKPAGAISTQRSPGSSAQSIADPRIQGDRNGPFGVTPWKGEANTVAGESMPSNGSFAVADPRPGFGSSTHHNVMQVHGWHDRSKTVTSGTHPAGGALSVADPRVANGHPRSVQLGVRRWGDTAAVVKGDVSVGTGPYGVADPRMIDKPRFSNVYRIVSWGGSRSAVTGPGGTGGGEGIADPRFANWHPGASSTKMRITPWKGPSGTATGSQQVGSGALAVADPRQAERADYKQTKYRVTGMEEAAGAVIGASTTGNGAFAVADPRPDGLKVDGDAYATAGNYGVTPWERRANAVSASAMHDNGFNSVADPRDGQGSDAEFRLPKPSDKLVCYIRALDGTWHRPFTTLELAALQGLVDPEETLILEGLSDSAWRERIGNAVPPPAAQAIASVMGQTLLAAWSGQTFTLSSQPIWVRPIAVALSVEQPEAS